MRDKDLCKVMQDLLPLYVEGSCSEGSCSLVEEHTAQCEECRALLRAMRLPLEVEPLPETGKISSQNALKKVRRRSWGSVLAVALAVALVVGLAIGTSACWRGDATPRNEEAAAAMDAALEIWQEEGAAAFVDALDPTLDYEFICSVAENGQGDTITAEEAARWKELGQKAFVEMWRSSVKRVLTEAEARGTTLKEYEYRSMSQGGTRSQEAWYSLWQVTFSDGQQGALDFMWSDGRLTLYWAGDAEEESKALFDALRAVVSDYELDGNGGT